MLVTREVNNILVEIWQWSNRPSWFLEGIGFLSDHDTPSSLKSDWRLAAELVRCPAAHQQAQTALWLINLYWPLVSTQKKRVLAKVNHYWYVSPLTPDVNHQYYRYGSSHTHMTAEFSPLPESLSLVTWCGWCAQDTATACSHTHTNGDSKMVRIINSRLAVPTSWRINEPIYVKNLVGILVHWLWATCSFVKNFVGTSCRCWIPISKDLHPNNYGSGWLPNSWSTGPKLQGLQEVECHYSCGGCNQRPIPIGPLRPMRISSNDGGGGDGWLHLLAI